MTAPLVIYVAGPYTNPDPVENTHNTLKVADSLLELGFAPLVPHLTLFWHAVSPKPYRDWLALDLAHMERCDAVLRIPGESSGADAEVAHAEAIGLPVFHTVQALCSWAWRDGPPPSVIVHRRAERGLRESVQGAVSKAQLELGL